MKLLVFLLVAMLPSVAVNAQDIIIKADQTEVAAKVIEITESDVKYKLFSRQDGPIYSLKKVDVFVILYKDGTRETFKVTSASSTESDYSKTPAAPFVPSAPTPVKSTYSSPATDSKASSEKRKGWSGSLGYTTATQSIGTASGITYGLGYYFLGRERKAGVVFDIDLLNFFGEGTPNYGLVSVNGLLRLSESSKFYLGGGVGYSTVSVEVSAVDRYGVKQTTKVSAANFGGKAFVGYGMLRVGLVWPSLQAIDSGGLLTIGLSINPFD